MKSIKKNIASLLALSVVLCLNGLFLVQLSSCANKGEDPGPSVQDEVKAKLTTPAKWNLLSVQVDGSDKTSVYAGLTISFTPTGYTTTNGRSLWPASGTWSFVGTDGKRIKREDGTEIGVEVTDSSLRLSFTWAKTTLGGGRLESISGQHVLTFGQ
jgi:hypothetical protein